jgi:hypothetical protein
LRYVSRLQRSERVDGLEAEEGAEGEDLAVGVRGKVKDGLVEGSGVVDVRVIGFVRLRREDAAEGGMGKGEDAQGVLIVILPAGLAVRAQSIGRLVEFEALEKSSNVLRVGLLNSPSTRQSGRERTHLRAVEQAVS